MNYDLLIIGAGPGGYVAAIRGAQLGFKVGLVEAREQPGGTCLNVGCIPSKALLESTAAFEQAQNGLAFGFEPGRIKPDWSTMLARKERIVAQNQKGLFYLFSKNKIDWIHGQARLLGPGRVEVEGRGELEARHVLLATGSEPTPLPFAPFDEDRILSSTGALSLPKPPKSLLVVGGGVIGLELGQVFKRLGAEVTVLELTDGLLPGMDGALGKELLRCFKKQKFQFKLGHRLEALEATGEGVQARGTDAKGNPFELEAERALVAVGRRPFAEGLGLEDAGVERDERGFVTVNERFETSLPGIHAFGDLIGGAMLAHKASEEGVWLVEQLAGRQPHRSPIPSVVYTHPEVASVGATEEQLTEQGTDFLKGQFNFRALGRSMAAGAPDGFAKVLAERETGRLLGLHLIGERATDLVSTAALALERQMTTDELGRLCQAHPSFAEALKEAALDAWNHQSIHQ